MLSAEPSFNDKGTIAAESCFLSPIYALSQEVIIYFTLYFLMGGFSSPFLDNGRIMVFESQLLNLDLAEKFDVLQQSCACHGYFTTRLCVPQVVLPIYG